jgi:hypothetical protein
MVMAMHQTRLIKWPVRIGIAMSVSLCWSLSHAADGRSTIEPVPSRMTMSTVAVPMEPAAPMPFSGPVDSGFVLRTLPTVSKPISVGGTTLLPYIGAGFSGGYATELDRSLNAQSASLGSLNAGPKNLFGPQLIPNEVQLGIRFPF